MNMRHLIAIAFVMGLAPRMDALAATAAGNPVHFSSCTRAGVEQCIVAKADDGETYNVTGAIPGLGPDQWLQGTGIVSDRVSLCMQGSMIDKFAADEKQKTASCKR